MDVSIPTIERVCQRFVLEGLEAALKPRSSRRVYGRKVDGEQEAHLVALACNVPPTGHKRWSLRLLADKMVKLEYIDSPSHEMVRQVLSNNELKPWLRKERYGNAPSIAERPLARLPRRSGCLPQQEQRMGAVPALLKDGW